MLNDITVIEFGDRVATRYCGRLLADAGARVVRIDRSVEDSPDRAEAAYQDYLNHGKQRLVLDAADTRGLPAVLAAAAPEATILVCDDDDFLIRTGLDELRAERAALAIVTVSDYGLDGPAAGNPATDFTLQAEAGLTSMHATAGRPPVVAGVELSEIIGGLAAALGAAAGLLGAQADTENAVEVDVSRFEALTAVLQYPWLFKRIEHHLPYPTPQVMVPGVEIAADGWVEIVAVTPQQWAAFVELAGVPELSDPRFSNALDRIRLTAEVTPLIRRFTRRHTVQELVEIGVANRIPVVPVATPDTVTEVPPFAERGFYRRRDAMGGYVHPGPPFRKVAVGSPNSTPIKGVSNADAELPLSGLRVVEFGTFQAGPIATSHLAALGADVIKVEAVNRPDMLRFTGTSPSVEKFWERAGSFLGANVGKRTVTLDLSDSTGLELARRLVATADIVLENYTPRVLEGYGLDFDSLSAETPGLIMIRMPAWGLEGSWRERPGMTFTAEAVAGLTAMSGYADGEPVLTGTIVDPIAAMAATFATLLAVRQRRLTGRGACLEVSLCDVAAQLTARHVVTASIAGQSPTRSGNRSRSAAPQGMYRCADDKWVALSVTTDEHWAGMCLVLKEFEWALDTRFDSAVSRRENHDVLDQLVAASCALSTAADVVAALRSAGIPAASMATGADANEHPQLAHRGSVRHLDHPVVGRLPYLGLPLRLSYARQAQNLSAAPLFGQDNVAVLTELGCTPEHIRQYTEAGLLSSAPFGMS